MGNISMIKFQIISIMVSKYFYCLSILKILLTFFVKLPRFAIYGNFCPLSKLCILPVRNLQVRVFVDFVETFCPSRWRTRYCLACDVEKASNKVSEKQELCLRIFHSIYYASASGVNFTNLSAQGASVGSHSLAPEGSI
jgi:hypothetical protein